MIDELYEGVERDYRHQARRTLSTLQLRWNHLKPFFGTMQAPSVTKETILAYIDHRLTEGAARATVNRELAALKRAFKLSAEKLPRLPVFPQKLEEDNVRTGFVEDEAYSRMIACASELWLRTYLEIAYSLGWRVSTILGKRAKRGQPRMGGLRVKHIDLSNRTIRVEAANTKNKMPLEVPIVSSNLHQLLTAAIAGKGPEDFVITRDGNRPIRDFRRRWKNLLKQAGLPPKLIVHDFRRSAARNLRKAGVAESVIMEICGWKTNSMFRRYDIVSNRDKFTAMERLEAQRAENGHSFGHSQASKGQAAADVSTAMVN